MLADLPVAAITKFADQHWKQNITFFYPCIDFDFGVDEVFLGLLGVIWEKVDLVTAES